MKIMVFCVPADSGGALTILKEYYFKAIHDKQNQWFFILSTPELAGLDNVKVLRYPWIKRSWFHRLFFDYFVAHKIVQKYKADVVHSLQNITIPKIKIKQILYLQQSLPFADKRYGLTEDFKFWVYQNIIGRLICQSIRRADKVIVQTNWMKEACIRKTKVAADKIVTIPPQVSIEIGSKYKQEGEINQLFFYPASAALYKNHKIILEAANMLKHGGIENYRVIFTLCGNENRNAKQLFKNAKEKGLPIDFIGKISIEQVYEYYRKAILIFPSYIETFGLPMLEAKLHGTPILASDCAFSHEILDNYEKVIFFDPFNSKDLSDKMAKKLV